MRFLHTADWQIGKPFQSITDPAKREKLRAARIETVKSLETHIMASSAQFVVVAGDLFDSYTPDRSTVAELCAAVGRLGVPVYAIPGNHDHAGPGCIWTQDFFIKEKESLAPNFHVLLRPEPLVTDEAILLPCPLARRQTSEDPTAWLREERDDLPPDRPRIILAHGSTQGFSSAGDDGERLAPNLLNLDRLPEASCDYIALGDWHGFKQISPQAWYSGTPEQDRFARGDENQPGYALVVDIAQHGATPSVEPVKTGRIGWHSITFSLPDDTALLQLEAALTDKLGQRAGEDLLKLELNGTLSLEGNSHLDQILQRTCARLIHLREQRELTVEPSATELSALTDRDDPLISQVAAQLTEESGSPDPDIADRARMALRELHAVLQAEN